MRRPNEIESHFVTPSQESYFAYLFGVVEPGFFGTIDLRSGSCKLFMPRLPAAYATWMGRIKPADEVRARYGVDEVLYTDDLAASLAAAPLVHLLVGLNTDSGSVCAPASFPGLEALRSEAGALHPVLSECRVVKSAAEAGLMRYAARVSSAAHCAVMAAARVGMAEYQLEALFRFYIAYYGGMRHVSYTCICATGPNAATLHYGHAGAPNDRTLAHGDMALLDMGGEYAFYGSDITRSFPVGGTFSAPQRLVYGAVLGAQDAVLGAMRPGVEWADMHRLAERTILAALLAGGLLQTGGGAETEASALDAMCGSHLGAVFMPHGLGHLLGIDTHDVGGYPPGRERIQQPGIRSLRMNRPLAEGMVVTVEPGCYFIDHLLDAALADAGQSRFLVPAAIAAFRGFGGVRLEDVVLVTAAGFENFTRCPRTLEEVEGVMAGAPWAGGGMAALAPPPPPPPELLAGSSS